MDRDEQLQAVLLLILSHWTYTDLLYNLWKVLEKKNFTEEAQVIFKLWNEA